MYIADPILIVAAVVPAVLLLNFVYKHDRLEKESGKLLITLVIFGIISTLLASATETLGITVLPYIINAQNSVLFNIILYFVVVACSEEGFKYLILKKKTWKNPEFNCQFDGVVYAVFVSLGFALWENIGYVIQYGISTAIARAVTAIPGHACFGVFMGAFYGMAKRLEFAGNASSSKRFRFLSFFVPMLLHGLYDYLAATSEQNDAWIFVAFVVVVFFVSFKLVKKLSVNDKYIDNPYENE